MIIEADVIGDEDAVRHLIETGKRAQDLRPAARTIRTLITEGHKRNWASRGAYLGSTWPPLAPSTVRNWGGGEVGVASGRLKAAVLGGKGAQTKATKTSVSVGVKGVPEAHLFAGGRSGGRGGFQPARPIIGVTRAQIGQANDILSTWITEGHA